MGQSDEKAITLDEARDLVADQALWPRVRDFLWDFTSSIHESWIEEQFGSVKPQNLQTSPRIKKFILDSLQVEPCFHTFPKDDGSRLLLLDGVTLESLVKWLGALACSDALRKVTDGATVRALKAALPGVYPEVFGFAAYFGKWKIENGEWIIGKDDVPQISCLGCRILFSVLSSLPAPLLRRLELKLPKNSQTSDAGTASEVPDSQFSTFNFQFIAKLLKLRFPEACSLCC